MKQMWCIHFPNQYGFYLKKIQTFAIVPFEYFYLLLNINKWSLPLKFGNKARGYNHFIMCFFYFHCMIKLLHGYYIRPNEMLHDKILVMRCFILHFGHDSYIFSVLNHGMPLRSEGRDGPKGNTFTNLYSPCISGKIG